MPVNLEPETAPPARQEAWWHWFAERIAPNPRVLLLVVVGWVTELVLLHCVSDNVFSVSTPIWWLAIEFTAWFWVTAGWIMWLVARRLRHPLARFAWGGLLAISFALYGISWGVYLRTGRFLDWDAVRFTFGNFHLLWMYARQAEHGVFLITMALVIAAAAAVVGAGSWLTKGGWSIADAAGLRHARRMTWYALGLGWILLLWAADTPDSMSIVARRMDVLRNGLHPTVTLAVGWVASSLEERIMPCIEPSELRPLTQAADWNKTAQVTNRENVILITIESMRYDVVGLQHQGREVMPTVNALARDGVRFVRAYSQTTHTDYSTTALYSSLFPLRSRRHLYFHANDPWPKTLFYDVLKPLGYATAIISSQNQGWGSMDNFLETPRLDLFYDPERGGTAPHAELSFDNLPDAQTVDKAIAWMAEQSARGVPFFVGINLQSPHFPYKLPADVEKPFQPALVDLSANFFDYPVEKVEPIRNAYYNALRECDRQIGRLVQALRADGQLPHTIIAVSGDHGEAFHEHGYVTHAREPIEPVIRTACVVYAPGAISPRIDDYPFELIDLEPTLLGLLGLTPHPNFQGIDALATNRPPREQRWLYFHVENPVAHADALLWMGRWKYTYNRQTRQESLFDLEADSAENDDLSARRPELTQRLHEVLQTWRQRQLAYYQFPMYYERYFPPLPPTPLR